VSDKPIILHPNPAAQAQFQRTVDERHAIAEAHCKAMGWPTEFTELSLEQIMEIRKLPAWIAAGRPPHGR
jgi:hypothetical protein